MFRLIAALLRILSRSSLERLGRWLGWFAFSVVRIRRGVTLDNIQRALCLSDGESKRLAKRVYSHLCIGALEFFLIGRTTPREASRVIGDKKLRQIQHHLEEGRGLLVLSAHLGNWDLLACCSALRGLKVNIVTRQIKATWLNRHWMAEREACGVTLLPAEGSASKIKTALRNNEIVAMVLDQHEPGGIPTSFFHRPAATGASLARLARATKSPVLPVFLIRESSGFKLKILEPLPLRCTSDRIADIRENTITFTRVIEEQVRRYPEQWLWLHRRWKISAEVNPISR